MFRLLNGMVYCAMNSLLEVESWSSMTKRTTASSGTYTSNWKFSFHDGLKPLTRTKKHNKTWPQLFPTIPECTNIDSCATLKYI